MHVCFVDEAGDLGALGDPPRPNDQPVLVIGGLFVDATNLASLTDNFLTLKHRYFPGLPYRSDRHLDRILPEIKGADIRSNATRGSARQRIHAIGFLDRILGLLRHHDVRMVARIWVKGIGSQFDATSVYTSSIQGICGYFERYLTEADSPGLCIADSRNKIKNVNVSHSIFTQKFSSAAPRYEPLVELPTFGHSENHAGLLKLTRLCGSVQSGLCRVQDYAEFSSGRTGNWFLTGRLRPVRPRNRPGGGAVTLRPGSGPRRRRGR